MRPTASDVPICHYRLSRIEYDRAVEAGAFEPDAKLELIDGDLNAMTPEGVGHTTGMDLVADCLRLVFGSGFHVRIQHPLAVDDYSEPEPDVAVVKGTIRDYGEAHPTEAVLVVEVSHESLRYDRTVKQRLYARCGIPEYWILALPDRRLEVYRGPAGDSYQSVTIHAAGDKVAPLARPDVQIVVDDLLP
ncbi:MAG: Uma2 family endonuclease [Acidobacteria bacterium]|nr:Uma2 family endonuclease [Acidobacteriota bacterium]MYK87455.1 Uma2 family endonuclease [Acidobacteriota bacterium]